MANTAFKTYAQEHGGRVSLLLLLFLLALYEFYTVGLSAFSIICLSPAIILIVISSFRYRMLFFWVLQFVNYLIQWKEFPSLGMPKSLPNELLEITLLALAIIDVNNNYFKRATNIMLFTLLVWASFCTLQVLNDTCDIGLNISAWYTGARMMAFQLIYAFLVYSIYISNSKYLVQYLFVWGGLALFASFWVWKQKYIGFTNVENSWIQGPGYSTHIIYGGTLIRYFSVFSDAANFGIGIASTSVAFFIFGIASRIRKHKVYFFIVGIACAWAIFPSGTRTAIVCFIAGFMAYIFLSKSLKIAIPFTLIFGLFVFMLVFTNIGNGNQQIRRMRSAFDKNDASANLRTVNQTAIKKYLQEAPWGIGIAQGYGSVPANNKYNFLSNIAADSEYVYIWIRTGVIGITIFLICTAIMFLGACWIVFFTLKSSSLRGIGAGFCCAFVSQQLGGYGNQVLMQFPNCLIFYGGLSVVYILPYIEQEWIEYENKLLAKQNEKKRLKLEKKKQSRVKTVF